MPVPKGGATGQPVTGATVRVDRHIMDRQKLFRGSIAVREEITGYYEVTATTRFEHDGMGEVRTFPHLSWLEVDTLVDALITEWTVTRTTHMQKVLDTPWVQLSLLTVERPDE